MIPTDERDPLTPVVYRLEPPCAGRLVLTRWVAALLVFPFVWSALTLMALGRSLFGARTFGIAAGRSVSHASALSVQWLRKASGWVGEKEVNDAERMDATGDRLLPAPPTD